MDPTSLILPAIRAALEAVLDLRLGEVMLHDLHHRELVQVGVEQRRNDHQRMARGRGRGGRRCYPWQHAASKACCLIDRRTAIGNNADRPRQHDGQQFPLPRCRRTDRFELCTDRGLTQSSRCGVRRNGDSPRTERGFALRRCSCSKLCAVR